MIESPAMDNISENKEVKTILIFGISSFVGSNLAEFLKNDFKVIGTYNSTSILIPGVLTLPCDVLSKEEVQLIIYAFKPDITIYSVGVSSILDCSKRESVADALNTNGLFNVTECCARYKSQICYISSCHVFGGEKKKYSEMDIPNAISFYGRTQASSEFYIQKNSLNYMIFRSCPVYGRSYNTNAITWFEKLEYKMSKGQKLIADNVVRTGFIDVFYLAMIMKLCFQKNYSNRLVQVSSTDIMSHYEFAKTYCEQFAQSNQTLSSGRWHYPISKLAHINEVMDVLHFEMDIANVEGFLKVKMPTIKESLQLTYKKFKGLQKSSKASTNSSENIKFI